MGGERHSRRLSIHVEYNSSRVSTRSPGCCCLLATAALAAFALDTVFEAVQADSPVHRFDMAAVLLPLVPAAGSMAVGAGSKVAAVAAEIES
jgi:hypothetical protein